MNRLGLIRDAMTNVYTVIRPFELNEGFRLMYIYTNIIVHGFLGNISVPLLCIISLPSKREEMISITFVKPYYLPVEQQNFDSIEISLRNELGNLMPFTGGKSAVTLHFKKLCSLI
jgi:hypothetical protein